MKKGLNGLEAQVFSHSKAIDCKNKQKDNASPVLSIIGK